MGGVRLVGVVVQSANHHRASPRRGVGQRCTLQLAGLVAGFEVVHVTCTTGSDPLGEEAILVGLVGTGHAGEIESGLRRQALDFVAKLERLGHGLGADYTVGAK